MTEFEPTSLVRTPRLLLRYAEQIGMDRHALMKRAELTPRMLEDPDARIRFSYVRGLWLGIVEGREDLPIGLRAGCSIRATELGIVGYAMFYSEDLLQACQRLTRYRRLLSEAIISSIKREGEHIVVTSEAHSTLLHMWHPIVASLAGLLTISREITRTELVPIEVHLPPPAPADIVEYRQTFRCPIYFDRPVASMTFSESQLHVPVKASDPVLSGYLEQLAGHVLKALHAPPESFLNTVRRALWYELSSGKPELWRIAGRLAISPRTLQRRLTDLGTSFSELLEDLRRELASSLLVDRKLAVSEVAFLLGYTEPSAFQRAFRRWQGVSPRQFRAA